MYVYSSDNASTTTITADGNAVVTVNFTEAPIYTVKTTYEDGTEIASANAFDGENGVVYAPYYRLAEYSPVRATEFHITYIINVAYGARK